MAKKRRRRNKAHQHRTTTQGAGVTPEAPNKAIRPTPERAQHGKVNVPFGVGKHERPATVECSDMVATLYEGGKITYSQEQAARTFQQLHADYVADLGISTGRSCLDIGPVGHDESDGNPEIAARHRRIVRELGMLRDAELRWVVLQGRRPRDLEAEVLRSALDIIAKTA